MSKLPVIYIAGPFRASASWEREKNVRVAEEAGLAVAKMGGVPLIPHTMYRHFDGEGPRYIQNCSGWHSATDAEKGQFWLDATLELLDRCDALFLLPGWAGSQGTLGEKALAEEKGLPVFYFAETEWEEWLDDQYHWGVHVDGDGP